MSAVGSAGIMVDTPLCMLHDRLREHGGDGAKSEDVTRGFVENLEAERLPRRVTMGELVELKGYTPRGKRTNGWCV